MYHTKPEAVYLAFTQFAAVKEQITEAIGPLTASLVGQVYNI